MLLLTLLSSALPMVVVVTSAQPVKQPNILLIFPDQWRFDWAGSVWNLDALRTPNFDAVVANGTVFTRAYVASPLCAPSRSCLAGGREYDQAGVPSNFGNDYPVQQTTFYKLLRDKAGYHVMTCGKDDLTKKSQPGLNGSYHAEELGFSDYLRSSGKMDVVNSKEPHEPFGAFLQENNLWDVHRAEWHGPDGDCQWKSYVCNKSSPLPDFAYEDNWIARNAMTLLSRKPANKPWYLQVNIAGPHPPFSITQNMSKTVRGREFPTAVDHTTLTHEQQQILRQDYAAEIENIDGWIGELLALVEKSGDMDNTLVCIASDHGEMLGDHDDWGKSQPWQGSASVPFTCMGKKVGVKVGQRITRPVSTMDMAATFLDYAGTEPDTGMTTTTLRPILEGKAMSNREFVSSGLGKWRAVVQYVNNSEIYKLICCNGTCAGQPRNATHSPSPNERVRRMFTFSSSRLGDCSAYPPNMVPQDCRVSLRDEEEMLVGAKPGKNHTTVLLYNLFDDPSELNNLAQDNTYKGVVNRMLPLMPPHTCLVSKI
eukprot:scpid58470/ scgid23137/ Arylsulfatase; Cys-type sulfatase